MSLKFNTLKLSLEQKIEILNYAYDKHTKWWVDILDVSISWARHKVNFSFDEIMKKFENKTHFTIFEREDLGETYGEIGFTTTFEDPSYFLWVYVTQDTLNSIVRKYELT